jgi:hypothetical protein
MPAATTREVRPHPSQQDAGRCGYQHAAVGKQHWVDPAPTPSAPCWREFAEQMTPCQIELVTAVNGWCFHNTMPFAYSPADAAQRAVHSQICICP